jgi:hypothetical protein
MEHSMRGCLVLMALVVGVSFPSGAVAAGGTAQGETSDTKGQQGLGLPGSGSSNVITGGPEIIEGKIISIQENTFPLVVRRGRTSRSG